jgi:hypothetical protein
MQRRQRDGGRAVRRRGGELMRSLLLPLCALPTACETLSIAIAQLAAGYLSSAPPPITDPEGSIVGSISVGNLTISLQSGGFPTLMDVDAAPDSW